MAASLRDYVRIRATNAVVYFWTVNESPPTTSLSFSEPQPIANFEVKDTTRQILDYITLLAPDGSPWHLRVNAGGALESVDGDVGGLIMNGNGIFGIIFRGSTWNQMSYGVSSVGVIMITNTPAPANDIVDPDYLDGTSRVAFCRQHNLVYRPDARIVYGSATHCPVDGARLRGWRDLVRDRQSGEDVASRDTYEDERW